MTAIKKYPYIEKRADGAIVGHYAEGYSAWIGSHNKATVVATKNNKK